MFSSLADWIRTLKRNIDLSDDMTSDFIQKNQSILWKTNCKYERRDMVTYFIMKETKMRWTGAFRDKW
jgi:hypothetical protein